MFTEQESKDLKIPLHLLNEWEVLMDFIWKWAIKVRLPGLENVENEIRFTGGVIHANFVNRKWIELKVRPVGAEAPDWVCLYYTGDKAVALSIVAIIVDGIINK